MSIREVFLQQTGSLLNTLTQRTEYLHTELGVVRERRLDAWKEGDLRENSAYHEAENSEEAIQTELTAIAKKMADLNMPLASDYQHSGFISAGSVVRLGYENGRERTVMLVPNHFAELEFGRIAIGSPVGQELEGKQAGASVTVVMPQKTSVYKILEVD